MGCSRFDSADVDSPQLDMPQFYILQSLSVLKHSELLGISQCPSFNIETQKNRKIACTLQTSLLRTLVARSGTGLINPPRHHVARRRHRRAGSCSAPVTNIALLFWGPLCGVCSNTLLLRSPRPVMGSLTFWWLRVGQVLELWLPSQVHQHGSEALAIPSIKFPNDDVIPPLKKGRAASYNVQTEIFNQ